MTFRQLNQAEVVDRLEEEYDLDNGPWRWWHGQVPRVQYKVPNFPYPNRRDRRKIYPRGGSRKFEVILQRPGRCDCCKAEVAG